MVARRKSPASADSLLQRQITSHLAETGRSSVRRLVVDVRDGRVTLRGCVASFYEKQLALQACLSKAVAERLIDAIEVAAAS